MKKKKVKKIKKKKIVCDFCGNKKIYHKFKRKNKGVCKKCFKRLEEWDLIDLGKKLKRFEDLSTVEFQNFVRDELLDHLAKLWELKEYLIQYGYIDEKAFKKFCKATQR